MLAAGARAPEPPWGLGWFVAWLALAAFAAGPIQWVALRMQCHGLGCS